jgi:hypothetical protein
MTFGSTFGRTFSPSFQPKSQAAVAGGGWWDLNGTLTSCIAAYQAKGAASYAASLDNLTGNATYDLTEVASSPTWDASYGWQGSTTNYLSTNIPSTSINDAITIAARWSDRNKSAGHSYIVGKMSYINGSNHYYGLRWHYTNYYFHLGNVSVTYNTAHSVSILAGHDAYADGVYKATIGDDDGYYISGNLPIINGDAKVQAIAIYSATLTSTQVENLYTAMAAL